MPQKPEDGLDVQMQRERDFGPLYKIQFGPFLREVLSNHPEYLKDMMTSG